MDSMDSEYLGSTPGTFNLFQKKTEKEVGLF